MNRTYCTLLWLLTILPLATHAQRPTVVTLYSNYFVMMYGSDAMVYGPGYGSPKKHSPERVREAAKVLDEPNGYLVISMGKYLRAAPAPVHRVAHYTWGGQHMLAVAETTYSAGGLYNHSLKMYTYSNGELTEATEKYLSEFVSDSELDAWCEANPFPEAHHECWVEYVLPRQGLTIKAVARNSSRRFFEGEESIQKETLAWYDFNLQTGQFERR